MNTLKNKHVLFICPKFYNYQQYIKEELENQGAKVTYLKDEAQDGFFFILRKLNPKLSRLLYSLLLYLKLHNVKNKYDILFTIRGYEISRFLIEYLSDRIENRILYLWDSYHNQPNSKIISPYFNRIYSFDYLDCENYNLQYLPLFFPGEMSRENNVKNIDLLFIGKVHTNRYYLIKKVEKFAKENGLIFVNKLYIKKIVFWKYKLFSKIYRKVKLDEFIFKPLNKPAISKLINSSKCVLDLSHNGQTGLSIRVFEILSHQSKLITNNEFITRESFYNPENILIIDFNNKYLIPKEFLNCPFQNTDFKQYSLKNWLSNLFYE